ncbi:hypothetical protein BD770DRAFT_402977 [Pilaira anomala]|nr:hypothetical protein BD770DRAFT_402977 [Pilaira anomala]
MNEIYNIHQHSHYLETRGINCKIGLNMAGTYEKIRREEYGISDYVIYDKQEKEIVYWEHTRTYKKRLEQLLNQLKQQKNKDQVVIDNFIEKVYLAFKKGNSNWNKDYLILEKVVIEFIRLLVDSMTGDENPIESVDSLHYIRVVPNMWEY